MADETHNPERRSLIRDALPAAAIAAVAASAASASAQTPGADPGYTIPGVRLAFTAWVQIGALRNIGEIPGGQGRIIPITGGEFEGPRLKGKVMAGGADWQTVRPDGVTELRAHYGLEADDGAIIQVWNNVIARADPPAQAGGASQRFLRSTIRLEAPKGPHDWLNKSVFIGTLNAPADPRAPVTIRCFEVI
jgi:hypothetical protein